VAGPATRPPVAPRFPALERDAGGYESFYVRAVDPQRPRSVWLRHTVHKAPGEPPVGSVWITLFTESGAVAHKVSVPDPQADPWLRVGASRIGPDGIRGDGYELSWEGDEAPLRHLPKAWMYTAALPRTKLESPSPAVAFSGRVAVGDTALELDRWPGMVGHNWGAQHAERWIWLHGTAFEGRPDAWLDIALGRIKVGPLTTPWIANGAVSIEGRRTRVGGPAAIRRTRVREDPLSLELELPGLRLTARSPRERTVVWRYADPDGSEHHTANCSVAALEVVSDGTTLRTGHGGAYELGMRETTHGLPVQPFSDP
jgi:hypothetical protein